MAVFAMPGRDVREHVADMAKWGATVRPDVFIYQWYVNDIEVAGQRPRNLRTWQRLPFHEWLRRWSYLYYYVDNRLALMLPPPERSYADYLVRDFQPGTDAWAEFERYFHELMTRAMTFAPSRYLLLYPQVPFPGTNPLQPIHDRMAALARPHRLSIPPATWVWGVGERITRRDAPWREAMAVKAGVRGTMVESRGYYLHAGDNDVVLTLEGSGAAPGGDTAPAGTLDVVDAADGTVLSTAPLAATAAGKGWQPVTLKARVPDHDRAVRLRVTSSGTWAFALGDLGLAVDYGAQIVDLTEALNAFNTHASIFDSHPNERAHQVIAQKLFEALQQTGPRH
jgi:hypothetical protein